MAGLWGHARLRPWEGHRCPGCSPCSAALSAEPWSPRRTASSTYYLASLYLGSLPGARRGLFCPSWLPSPGQERIEEVAPLSQLKPSNLAPR